MKIVLSDLRVFWSLPNLPRFAKIFIVILVDVSSCVLSTWLALYVRLGEFVTLSNHALVAVCYHLSPRY